MSDTPALWWKLPPSVKMAYGGHFNFVRKRGMVDKAVAMTLRRRIQQRLDALGLSMRAASKRAGLGTHFIRDLMDNPLQSPKAANLAKLAIALETTPEWLLEERGSEVSPGVPIMGFVGAGAHYHVYEDQGNLDFAERPPNASEAYGAAWVKGHSQHPVYRDGELIYFTEFRDDVADFIGEDVIAELADGQMVLKTLARSTSIGLYTLRSHNAPDMPDVQVVRVAAVRWIDRGARRK